MESETARGQKTGPEETSRAAQATQSSLSAKRDPHLYRHTCQGVTLRTADDHLSHLGILKSLPQEAHKPHLHNTVDVGHVPSGEGTQGLPQKVPFRLRLPYLHIHPNPKQKQASTGAGGDGAWEAAPRGLLICRK